jgi:hypothetical protein
MQRDSYTSQLQATQVTHLAASLTTKMSLGDVSWGFTIGLWSLQQPRQIESARRASITLMPYIPGLAFDRIPFQVTLTHISPDMPSRLL